MWRCCNTVATQECTEPTYEISHHAHVMLGVAYAMGLVASMCVCAIVCTVRQSIRRCVGHTQPAVVLKHATWTRQLLLVRPPCSRLDLLVPFRFMQARGHQAAVLRRARGLLLRLLLQPLHAGGSCPALARLRPWHDPGAVGDPRSTAGTQCMLLRHEMKTQLNGAHGYSLFLATAVPV